MHRKYNLAHLILASVAVLMLTPLMVVADAQGQIVFSSNRDGNHEIYVMDTDGRNQQRLTKTRHQDWEPSWSPDGKRIAFTSSGRKSTEDGRWGTYVMDADGKNTRKLSNDLVNDRDPSWSPDGKHITFVSRRDGRGFGIYVMDADGKNEQRLTDNLSHEWDSSWSPDGKRIAFVSRREENTDIYVMNADGENQRRLTRNPAPDTDPSWSPDGKRIVFVSTRDGGEEIYTMNTDGARWVRRRTINFSEDTNPAWFDPAFAVEIAPFSVGPRGKKFTMWAWLKQVDQ